MREHELRCGRSVDRPYATVMDILTKDAVALFQRATTTAANHADFLDSTLKVSVAGHEVDRDVRIEMTSIDLSGRPPSAQVLPAFALSFTWKAAASASLFPAMRAELTAYPLSDGQTQLDLHGWYEAPGGVLGAAADALVGHRLAEASVARFLDDVVRGLEADTADAAGKLSCPP